MQRPREIYMTIDGWPSFNNMNRAHTGEGVCPTLTTQTFHSKPPLVAIRRTRVER